MPAEKQKKPEELTDDERQAIREARRAMDAQDAAMNSGGLPEPAAERPAAEIVRELEDGVARREAGSLADRPHIVVGGSFENPRREPDAFERWVGGLVKKVGRVFRRGRD